MVEQHAGHNVELFLPSRIARGLQTLNSLDLKLHRSQRILDFVRYISGHLAPRLIPFGLGQYLRVSAQVVDHSVIGIHDVHNLVVVIIAQVFQLFELSGAHGTAHHRQWHKCLVDEIGYREGRYDEQDEEYHYDVKGVHEGIELEVASIFHIRR